MKIIIAILSVIAALIAAAVSCGYAVNAVVVLSSCIASGIAGLFVADYSHKPDYRAETFNAPATVQSRRAPVSRHVEASSPIFASLIVFNTTIA